MRTEAEVRRALELLELPIGPGEARVNTAQSLVVSAIRWVLDEQPYDLHLLLAELERAGKIKTQRAMGQRQ